MTSPAFPWTSALVTGASSGIGEELAVQLATAGVPTVIVARRGDRLKALAKKYPTLEPLVADLATAEGRQTVADRLSAKDRPIDLLVNNAGFGVEGMFGDATAQDHVGMIDVNVTALTVLTHAAITAMRPRRKGWILQVSSVASFQPGPGAATYSATKAFVTSLTEAIHEELRGSGVTITALCPGFTRSEFHDVSGSRSEVDKMPDVVWLSAQEVAASGLEAVAKGRAIDVPGVQYKLISALSGSMPRSLVRRAAGIVAGARK